MRAMYCFCARFQIVEVLNIVVPAFFLYGEGRS